MRVRNASRPSSTLTRQLQNISTQLIHENDTQAQKILDAAVVMMLTSPACKCSTWSVVSLSYWRTRVSIHHL